MQNVKNMFEYLKLSDNLLCRYPLGSDEKTFHILGEVYDNNSKKWILKSSTMSYKMSGEGNVISEEEALKLIKKINKNNI